MKKNKEENSSHMTFHTCKIFPAYFMSLVEFLKRSLKHCKCSVLSAVIFFMSQYRTREICLDVMKGPIYKFYINSIPFIFSLSFKEISVFSSKTKNKVA